MLSRQHIAGAAALARRKWPNSVLCSLIMRVSSRPKHARPFYITYMHRRHAAVSLPTCACIARSANTLQVATSASTKSKYLSLLTRMLRSFWACLGATRILTLLCVMSRAVAPEQHRGINFGRRVVL